MKFNLAKLDYTKEVTEQLKNQHYKNVNQLIKSGEKDNNGTSRITLFHGTSLYYLNNILTNGILTRNFSKRANYNGELSSNENLVYLTNKWHYWYAIQSYRNLLSENKKIEDLNMPCYVECKVKANNLIIDEDFFHSKYIKNRITNLIKKGNPILEISYEECLAHYATVAHIGNIDRKDIVSFTILANFEILKNNFVNPKSQYQKDLIKWGSGKGKGSLKFYDLLVLEDDELNMTFQMNNIPEDYIITNILYNKEKGKYSLQFNRITQ